MQIPNLPGNTGGFPCSLPRRTCAVNLVGDSAVENAKWTHANAQSVAPHFLGKDFDLVTNIRRADVRENMGWLVLEIEGTDQEIERGVSWVSSLGVRVDPVSGDVIEG